MTEIIISEKPSAALKLATALADTKPVAKKVGRVTYYELKHKGKDIVVVCAVGHLYTVTEKEKKGMRYPVFDIKWDEAATVKKEAAFTKQYLDVIKKLAKDADIFTVACDYDIEGEVIGWNVIRFACNKKDAKRMKFSTLTKDELVSSYENASKHLDWGQAKAGETRHLLDWVWGLNLSRALTLSIKNSTGMFKLMSAGRVQGPALKILADKEREIKKFKAEPYWEIELTALKDKTEVKALHKEDKFWDKKKAEQVIKNTKGKKAKVDKVTKKEIIQKAPNPFDLTTLQTEAYRTLRISPKETLAIAQDLYIKAYISYPRTSSQVLPESINYKKILTNLSKIKDYKGLCEELLKFKKLKPNNGKKTDPAHPAVHPTGIIPKGLNERAKKVYSLIVRRFMASFAPDAKRESVNVEIDINKEIFIARGIRTKEAGWHKWYGGFLRLKEEELPKLEEGEELKVKSVDMYDKETQPPKRYTPASIIKELSNRNVGTKSISGDTFIYINGKWIKIKELFKSGSKTNEELLVKIPVTTYYNLKDKKIDIKKNILVAKRFKKDNEKIFSIETPFTKIVSDAEHRYFLLDENGVIYEKFANSLNIGENLLFTKLNSFGSELITEDLLNSINRKYNIMIKGGNICYQNGVGFRVESLPILESSKLFWLLGYIYGDGSICIRKGYEGYGVGITVDKNEKFLIKKIIKTIEDLFGKDCYGITTPSNRNVIRIDIPSVISYYLVKKFPSLISKSVFDIPEEYRGDFIKGYMDADGNIHLRQLGMSVLINGLVRKSNGTPRIKLVLSREHHILWIKQMLNSLNINTTTIKCKIAKIKDSKFKCYELKISGKNNILLYAIYVGFEHPKKRNLLYKGLLCNSLQYTPIKKVINCFSILLKNNNQFTKFENRLTYILKNFEELGIIERKIVCCGRIRKYAIRIPQYLITKVTNFLLPIYGEEIIPWHYAVKITNQEITCYNGEELYDLIVDKENPTFITLGGQIIHNSTRAAIIDNLYKRNYVAETSMEVTNLGMKTVETLEKYSPDILDEELTRKFEEDMEKIRESKSKPEDVMKKAEKILTKILKDFKEKEKDIGKKLSEANVETRELESELGSCLKCKDGTLRIMYSKKVKNYFVGCSSHPKCDAVYSLPRGALIKPAKKECEHCKLPKVLVIRKGRKPQELCINPDCSEKKREERKIKKDLKEVEDRIKDKKCPECKEGSLILRKSFYGFFIGCSNYPKCRYTENIKNKENK